VTTSDAVADAERRLAAAGVPTPRVDAEWVVAHVAGVSRSQLALGGDVDAARVRELVEADATLAGCRNEDGISARMLALYRGDVDMLEALVDAGPELDVFEAAGLGAEERLEELLGSVSSTSAATEPPRAYYAQFPQHQVWAEVLQGESHEPLDGCFVHSTGAATLRVLGVFGVRPERLGFSVVEAEGPRALDLRRPDGSPLFSPVLPGGASAGLHSIAGGEELLELGWRTRAMASEVLAPAR
jgi:hypothetical protein